MFRGKLAQRFNDLKIRNKLIVLLIFLVTVPMIIFAIFSYHFAARIVKEKVDYNLKSSVQQITYNLDVILGNMRSIVEDIYKDRVIQKFLANGSKMFTRQQFNDLIIPRVSKDNTSIYLFSIDGSIYGYNMNYANTEISYKEMPEYKKSEQNNDKLIWLPTNHSSLQSSFFPDDNKNRFSIAMIMKDFDSMREVGFVVATFEEDSIFNIYHKIRMTENSYGFVLDKDGNIISHEDKAMLGKRTEFYSNIKDKLYKSQNGSFITIINHKKCVVIFDTLATTNWKLVYVIPSNDLVKDIILVRNTFLIILVLCLIVSTAVAFLIAGSISNPIVELISHMDKFGAGDLSVRITKYNHRSDEIGILAAKFNSMIIQINSLIKNNYHNEIKKKEAEMKALQAQINPHFLYNTLDCINFIARKHKVEDISKMVLALADLMRISIRKDRNMITVREEVNYIQNYMMIQKIRYRDKLSLHINIDESLYDNIIPKLIIQPIIENAVVHGIEQKIGEGTVLVNGYRHNQEIIFEIIDDGVGLDEARINSMLRNSLLRYENISEGTLVLPEDVKNNGDSSSIGMFNVDMRLKIIYGKQYGITVKSRKNEGTKVTIKLPSNGGV